jgi:hypothetical protein
MRGSLCSLLLLSCSVTLLGCGPFAPTAADKEVCLTLADLIERGVDADASRGTEKWFGVRSFGTHQLMYDYNEPTEKGRQFLFVQCQSIKQRTSVEAMAAYRMQILTSKAFAIGEIDEKMRTEGKCAGADACVLLDFLVKGQRIGNHFVVRSGRHVVSATILGPHFDDVDEWRDVVARKVEAIKALE